MKCASLNVRGFNNPDKVRSIWQVILAIDLDVIYLQDHKSNFVTHSNAYFHDYTLFYGGLGGGYFGTLSIIKNSLCPRMV